MKTAGVFWKKAERFSKLGRPTIAFGLVRPDKKILTSLRRSKKYADIHIVGPSAIRSISGFHVTTDKHPEEKLAALLASGEVDGIVRGTIDDKKTLNAYTRMSRERDTICPALLEEPGGRQFFICPVSNTDGWTKKQRLEEAKETARFVRQWGIKPSIAVYTGIRHETYQSGKRDRRGLRGALNKTYEDARWIVSRLRRAGYLAENMTIELDTALAAGHNIHIPVNGIVGNQIVRALVFCGGKILTATRIGLFRAYEDNSRSEKDFESHIFWLAGYINKKRHDQKMLSGARRSRN